MIVVIAAVAKNSCIGIGGKLPWHLPEDMARFKALTTGKIVLMGRRTWESLPEKFRPLPNRTNIVVTRQERYDVPPGVLVSATIDDAFRSQAHDDVFIIGGADVYRQAIDRADRLQLTHVDRNVEGDAFFPEVDPAVWREIERENHDGFAFAQYERIENLKSRI